MLDGKSNIEQIIEKTDKALIEANLSLNIDGKTVTDKDARSKLIRELVLNALQLFLLYGFLVK
ncbi:MAG UNVERIFIED_CONTAM: hypothetical protein LVQ98_02300 [Rickettsiaceae bacterium]